VYFIEDDEAKGYNGGITRDAKTIDYLTPSLGRTRILVRR